MRVIICGSRNWSSWDLLRRELRRLPSDSVVIHGDARGADKMGAYVAKDLGFRVIPYPADWDRHGKAAGHIRNQQMLDEGNAERVIAFWDGVSTGTRDMIDRGRKAGLAVTVVLPDGSTNA